MNHDDETEHSHPSFGNIQISRCSGHTALYDSPLRHQHFIALRVSTASYKRGLNRRWHRDEDQIVEVYMSPAQFVEAMTSMNTQGTPCTLMHYRDPKTGEVMRPRLEGADHDRDTHVAEVKEACQGVAEAARRAVDQLDDVLSGKAVKKGDLKELRATLGKLSQDVSSNLPFIQSSFVEAMEKVEQHTKAEIVALADQVVHSRGLQALGVDSGAELLGEKPEEDPPKQLEAGMTPPKSWSKDPADPLEAGLTPEELEEEWIESEVERRVAAALEEVEEEPHSDSPRAMFLRQNIRAEVEQELKSKS